MLPCQQSSTWIEEFVSYAVWENDCVAYTELRKQVEPFIREYEKGILSFQGPFVETPKDTAAEPVRWHYWNF